MLNMNEIAFLFPGQGSQFVGMAADLAAAFPAAAAILEQANDILGVNFSGLMRDGPQDDLDDTHNTQPALYIAGVATLRALESHLGRALVPLGAAGHSLGELTALTAAGALPFEAGLRLVRQRAWLMKEAGAAHPGAMAALLGPTVAEAEALCREAAAQTGKPLVVANDNCPGQVVISGDRDAIDCALALAKQYGSKRAIKLAVSVAAHSPLMQSAGEAFSAALDAVQFAVPRYPVVSNTTGGPLRTVAEIHRALGLQITSSVRWTESVRTLRALGAQTFLELGPRDVLTNLLKRIDKDAIGVTVNSADAVKAL